MAATKTVDAVRTRLATMYVSIRHWDISYDDRLKETIWSTRLDM